jgi:Protein of unknown function (DUF2878)
MTASRRPDRLALLDAAGQQAAWWAAVLSAAHGHQAWGVASSALLVTAHLAWRHGQRATIVFLACAAAGFGAASDGWLAANGLIAFAGQGGWARGWMVALWAVFGVALTASLRAIVRWPLPALALAGAMAGPLAYQGGAKLGALSFPGGAWPALGAVALQWACALPLLAALALARGGWGAGHVDGSQGSCRGGHGTKALVRRT